MRRRGMLLVLVLALSPLSVRAEDDPAALEKRVASAQSAVDTLRTEMQSRFVALNADFKLIRSPRWASLRNPFIDAVTAAVKTRNEASAAELKAALTAGFRSSNVVATTTADRLAGLAATALAAAEEPVDATAILTAAVTSLFPEKTFQECWDTSLQDLPMVVRWREGNAELATAKKALAAATAGTEEPPTGPPGMVLIEKGPFVFGPWPSWDNDLKKKKAERPRLAAYFIDVHEVTNEEYAKFLATLSAKEKKSYLAFGFTLDEEKVTVPPKSAKLPVRGIPFAAARDYAKWVGKRLPTEEEWEKAARGVRGLEYPWGKEFVEDAANWRGRFEDPEEAAPVAVGTSPGDKSPYGVMDMAGNVSEFTSYMSGRRKASRKLGTTDEIVFRGGSFADNQSAMVGSYRWIIPALQSSENVGFRCVLSEKNWKPK